MIKWRDLTSYLIGLVYCVAVVALMVGLIVVQLSGTAKRVEMPASRVDKH